MPTINPTLPADDTTAEVADYNVPIQAILALINGQLDGDNIAPGSLPWSVMDSFTNEIPAAAMEDEGNLKKFRDEAAINFVATGLVWSATSGLDGAMTAGTLYGTDGGRVAVNAVTSKTFTASKDTYVDVTDAGSVGYTEVANGAASPALGSTSTRIAKVVTDGSSVTSVTITGRDSLGNPIKRTSVAGFDNLPVGAMRRIGSNTKTTTSTLLTTSYATHATVAGSSTGGVCEAHFSAIIQNAGSGSGNDYDIKVQCDGVDVTPVLNSNTADLGTPVEKNTFSFMVESTPAAGSHTWTIQAKANANNSVYINQAVLRIVEVKG